MAAGAWGVETGDFWESFMERLCRGVEAGGKDGSGSGVAVPKCHFGGVCPEMAAR